ncbi:unnamed protein product [Caenorhabditis auriculariae]|uniref:Uncharacterized protein n=1 Tax=Caenorhabditis auriculariae TaxID=2777116 RepID=A0A8S1GU59_9PELO|nr:unnamed protein product [Caenorhabditis auriculariae]
MTSRGLLRVIRPVSPLVVKQQPIIAAPPSTSPSSKPIGKQTAAAPTSCQVLGPARLEAFLCGEGRWRSIRTSARCDGAHVLFHPVFALLATLRAGDARRHSTSHLSKMPRQTVGGRTPPYCGSLADRRELFLSS